MINAAIFDFNGTLFWDTAMHNEAWDRFLEQHGIALSNRQKHETMHGKNNREILRAIFGPELETEDADTLSQEKEAIYRTIADREGVRLADGAPELFDDLVALRVPFTIATASEKVNLDFYFERLSLDRWFSWDRLVYNDLTLPSKPDPTMYLKAAAAIGMAPGECVIFEDSISGIRAAENAGAAQVIVVNSNDEEYPEGAHIITSFHDVDRLIFQRR